MREFNALREFRQPKEPRYVGPNIRKIKNRIIASYRDEGYYDSDIDLAELHLEIPDCAHEISEVEVLQENERLKSEDPALSTDCQDLSQRATSFSNHLRIVKTILTYCFIK